MIRVDRRNPPFEIGQTNRPSLYLWGAPSGPARDTTPVNATEGDTGMTITHLNRTGALAAIAVLAALPAAAMAASTVESTARGISVIKIENYPMADGSTVQSFTFKIVQENVTGGAAGERWGGDCVGDGVVTADGAYTGSYRCTINVTADDAYTLYAAHDAPEGADFVITGGKGKYKGATGSGHTTYTWGDTVFGDRIAFESETSMTLP